jgi:hypothetical protein
VRDAARLALGDIVTFIVAEKLEQFKAVATQFQAIPAWSPYLTAVDSSALDRLGSSSWPATSFSDDDAVQVLFVTLLTLGDRLPTAHYLLSLITNVLAGCSSELRQFGASAVSESYPTVALRQPLLSRQLFTADEENDFIESIMLAGHATKSMVAFIHLHPLLAGELATMVQPLADLSNEVQSATSDVITARSAKHYKSDVFDSAAIFGGPAYSERSAAGMFGCICVHALQSALGDDAVETLCPAALAGATLRGGGNLFEALLEFTKAS